MILLGEGSHLSPPAADEPAGAHIRMSQVGSNEPFGTIKCTWRAKADEIPPRDRVSETLSPLVYP